MCTPQLRLADTIADLLSDLRTCGTPGDYHQFQGTLFHELHDLHELHEVENGAGPVAGS